MAGPSLWRAALERLSASLDRREVKLGLQSNLWLLDDEYCRLFQEHGVHIGTSLDGPQDITDAQRGTGSFAKVMAGIDRARRWGLDVGCIATVTRWSAPRAREIFDFFVSERLAFSVHAAIPALDGRLSGGELPPDLYGKVLMELLGLYVERRREVRIATLDEMIRGVVEGRGGVCTFQECLGCFLAIDPNGDIFPCQRLCGRPEYRLGRLADAPSLPDLLASPVARRLAARQHAVREICGACAHVDYCLGGCPYNAWATSGATGVRDPLCAAYRSVYDEIWQRVLRDMESGANLEQVASGLWDRRSPLLLRKGPMAELARRPHPVEVARSARRVVAAYELGRDADFGRVCDRLVAMRVCPTRSSAVASLDALKARMRSQTTRLNKLYLHVTLRCSLACNHCYVSADSSGAGAGDMPVETVERVLSAARDAGFRRVVITGGEPLCHTDRDRLLAVLAAARSSLRPLTIGLRSNLAAPLSADLIARIAAAADQLGVSIDGDRDLHDARRGPGQYEATVANLERYLEFSEGVPHGARLMIAAVLTANEARGKHRAAVWSLAARLGVAKVTITPPLPLGRAGHWGSLPAMEPRAGHLYPDEEIANGYSPAATCGLGQVLFVLPDGSAYPCRALWLPQWRLGSVVTEGLGAIVRGDRFQFLQSRSVDTNRGCQKCDVRYICGGPCRAWRSDAQPCDIDAPPPDCAARELHACGILDAAYVSLGLPET